MFLSDLVDEFLFDCKVRALSELTVNNYRKQLKKFLLYLETAHGVTALEQMRPALIKQYISFLQGCSLKPAYINDLLKAVKCLCRYAFDEGYTEGLITERIKNVKQKKVLIHTFSNKEIAGMIKYYSGNNYLDVRNKLIIMILFDTGIRVSELTHMMPEQVKEGYFIIFGKGGKERLVPQNASVAKMLIRYRSCRERYFSARDAQDYLFLSKNGKYFTPEAINKMLKKAASDIGVSSSIRVSPHTCRHTFAHQQLKNGLDLYSLSRLLGHENVSITQRYLEGIEDTQILNASRKTGVISNL